MLAGVGYVLLVVAVILGAFVSVVAASLFATSVVAFGTFAWLTK